MKRVHRRSHFLFSQRRGDLSTVQCVGTKNSRGQSLLVSMSEDANLANSVCFRVASKPMMAMNGVEASIKNFIVSLISIVRNIHLRGTSVI